MIKIEHPVTTGIEAAIIGMRNSFNSWDRCDSYTNEDGYFVIGPADKRLALRLINEGSPNRKFIRMIDLTVDITAPLYWWKEFDTYKVGTVANSCSTMHKIAEHEFTVDDFSHEHVIAYQANGVYVPRTPAAVLDSLIMVLNISREEYIKAMRSSDPEEHAKAKSYWWQMIQLLPSSYNQKRTVKLNYEVLRSMYQWRHDHKLDEWRAFCMFLAAGGVEAHWMIMEGQNGKQT